MTKKDVIQGQVVPDIQHTLPEVFILESLSKKDERHKRFEGLVLSDMLRLAGKNPKYYYFQNKEELTFLMGLYRQSKYRYLHISVHGSESNVGTTNDILTYDEFSNYFATHLRLRRLFLSACSLGNENFMKTFGDKNKGMHSIVAPIDEIRFDHAAAVWSTFYISMFSEDENKMNRERIKRRIEAMASLFPIDFMLATYFPKRNDWSYTTIKKRQT